MDRRKANHAAAVADGEPPAVEAPDHPLICADEPQWIDTPQDWSELLDHVRHIGWFAYDTEFIGEDTYWPKLCLVQISTAERVAVADAAAEIDLTGLWELLAEASIQKIVHAGQQDLEPALRHLGRPATNVFDTQVAAAFAALPYPLSLSKLLAELLDVKLGKGLTFTSWDERPLPKAHLRYAADDVRYLPALHAALGKRLEITGHARWAQQQCEDGCAESVWQFDAADQTLRIRGAKNLSGRRRQVLLELVRLRDEIARREDVPVRSLMRDEVLMELVRSAPIESSDQLKRVRGLPWPVEQRHGQQIIETLERGLNAPRDKSIRVDDTEESPRHRFDIDALWAALQAYCRGCGVDPTVVANRSMIAAYWLGRSNGKTDNDQPLLRGWRAELLGGFLDDFVNGRRRMTLAWAECGLTSEDPSAPPTE